MHAAPLGGRGDTIAWLAQTHFPFLPWQSPCSVHLLCKACASEAGASPAPGNKLVLVRINYHGHVVLVGERLDMWHTPRQWDVRGNLWKLLGRSLTNRGSCYVWMGGPKTTLTIHSQRRTSLRVHLLMPLQHLSKYILTSQLTSKSCRHLDRFIFYPLR